MVSLDPRAARPVSTAGLVFEVHGRWCAIALEHVVETLRPLPVQALAGMPPYVLGLSVVRGEPIPVVHVGRLIGAESSSAPLHAPSRYVVLRLPQRRLALAVDAVLGVRDLPADTMKELSPLLGETGDRVVQSVGVRDDALVLALRAARLLPADVERRLSVEARNV